jgi:hypothetical protein
MSFAKSLSPRAGQMLILLLMDELRLSPDAGGWVHADWVTGHCWVRFAPDADGKLALSALHTTEPRALRAIPLGRIVAAVEMRGAGAIVLALAIQMNEQMPLERLSDRPEGGAYIERRYVLAWKNGQRLDDAFYRNVAHAYQSCVALGLRPNRTIADDVGAAIATVTGWIAEARRRQHLPAAVHGRAGTPRKYAKAPD